MSLTVFDLAEGWRQQSCFSHTAWLCPRSAGPCVCPRPPFVLVTPSSRLPTPAHLTRCRSRVSMTMRMSMRSWRRGKGDERSSPTISRRVGPLFLCVARSGNGTLVLATLPRLTFPGRPRLCREDQRGLSIA
jgi:hypothetical protein